MNVTTSGRHQPRQPARCPQADQPCRQDTGDQTGDQASQEAGSECHRDGAAHESWSDAGTPGQGVSDVAAQRRHQEAESSSSDGEHHRSQSHHETRRHAGGRGLGKHQGTDRASCRHSRLAGIGTHPGQFGAVASPINPGDQRNVEATEQEAKRDQQPTGSHKRDHVGHASHQGDLDTPAPTLLGRRALSGRCRLSRGRTGNPCRCRITHRSQSLGDELVRLIDPPFDAGLDHRQACEPLAVPNRQVGGEDGGIGSGNDGRIQPIDPS